MRRRVAAAAAPLKLLVFEGRRYRTEQTWRAAFDEFLAARDEWSCEHDGEVLARFEVDGDCPFDPRRFEPAKMREPASEGAGPGTPTSLRRVQPSSTGEGSRVTGLSLK